MADDGHRVGEGGGLGPRRRLDAFPAWPLAAVAGLLPLAATLVAYGLSVRLGLVEGCMPLTEGCVSISRSARVGLPNHIFRALMLPAAALQGLCWLMCAAWLHQLGVAHARMLRALPWLGLVAAVFLVVYGTFLGTEGQAYRWMRRYGVVAYFGGTALAMLVVTGAVQQTGLRTAARVLLALCAGLPLLGLLNGFAPVFAADGAHKDALQNVAEWWGGLIFTLFFLAIAWLWRATRFELRFGARMPAAEVAGFARSAETARAAGSTECGESGKPADPAESGRSARSIQSARASRSAARPRQRR